MRSHMLQPTSLIPSASAASSPPQLRGSLLGGAAAPCPCRIFTDWIVRASWRTPLSSSQNAASSQNSLPSRRIEVFFQTFQTLNNCLKFVQS